MTLVTGVIIQIAAVIGAAAAIFGAVFSAYRWYLKQGTQDEDIARIKEENALVCFALSACLDGLMQLGANHVVPVAKDKLDKYLNQQAHR